ncbi:argininosuccinate lyase [Carnobacterium alterfunditum]|uniref:Argininosuccinate lyase n=1 Tax=Carnobacterium alterfunditum TaxID=28230 RepID=A0A1N6GYL5_9LACT|nr:argininosuccinate lyase [Carnobacterium alterfunditum]SIO12653.1 argininosuccinate lyase [Carnobacterium alterfunditum]
MKKLWGGRFEGESQKWIDEFGASIEVDQVLAEEDIIGSLAHVKMLAKTSIILQEEADEIIRGLEILLVKAQKKELVFSIANEDIHLNIETLLHKEIGLVAGKLHTARSRNDQVATDMHLYLKRQVGEISGSLMDLEKVILLKAEKHVETIIPGYTHLQHAQPISFAHHLLAYYNMFKRDLERYQDSLKRIDCSPLGAAALAGTTFPIDRLDTAEQLGFSSVYSNSMDAVSDRDFILEFLSNSSILMVHLSRFCEEIILWTSHEYQFVSLTDAFSTGSSIMPQKKNPDMAELIRGKTGRVYGNLFSLLTVMKSLPLAYNKDLQEDKEGMFDTVKTVKDCLNVFAGMLDDMIVHEEKMSEATTKDFSNATELADYLASRGIPFREAHEIVGKLVLKCLKNGNYLQDISLADFQEAAPIIQEDVYSLLESRVAVERRNSLGGTGFVQIRTELEKAKKECQLN